MSVVTVCRNAQADIEPTIQSVAAQAEHAQVEYVIVDGGSTDGTHGIVRKHDQAVSRFVSEPDHGIYDAMNKALDLCTGDFVHFLNAGDMFVDAHTVERAVADLAREGGADVVYGDALWYDDRRVVRRSGRIRNRLELYLKGINHQSAFVRRSFYHELGAFDVSIPVYADYDVLLRGYLGDRHRFRYVPRPIVFYRAGDRDYYDTIAQKYAVLSRLAPPSHVLAVKAISKALRAARRLGIARSYGPRRRAPTGRAAA